MKIAIIGAGISGLTVAHLLHREHEITLYESEARLGGHTRTEAVESWGRTWNVDTGFVVYNEKTYPNFVRLLDRLGVETRQTSMSFSVSAPGAGLEYCGTSLNTLFAQRRNLFRPSFHLMIRDILRFNRRGRELLAEGSALPTLRAFLDREGLGEAFRSHYLLPMAAAIWSATPEHVLDFPADFFLRFFDNHGLLSERGHLQWRVVKGGSYRYVDALAAPFLDRARLSTPVERVRRLDEGISVRAAGDRGTFDEVILAVHGDQALRMLEDPSPLERQLLEAFSYQANEAVLHTDARLLPGNFRARASWNYHVPAESLDRVQVTYDMSRLQGLDSPDPFCVSLNATDRIDPACRLRTIGFHHPIFKPDSIEAQARHGEVSGVDRVHYCGAWWGNGFHEDGVRSALEVAARFGKTAADL